MSTGTEPTETPAPAPEQPDRERPPHVIDPDPNLNPDIDPDLDPDLPPVREREEEDDEETVPDGA